jgi:hypothetical protein
MLQDTPASGPTSIEMCLDNAAAARTQAKQTSGEGTKNLYAAIERSWSCLAESIARNERLDLLVQRLRAYDPASPAKRT